MDHHPTFLERLVSALHEALILGVPAAFVILVLLALQSCAHIAQNLTSNACPSVDWSSYRFWLELVVVTGLLVGFVRPRF